MRLLRAADHRRMAWKNGGGETTEIAVHPPGAGLADFDWRISTARVAADGPFSAFPGIDRTLAVLDGAGLELTVAAQGRHRLTVDSDPHAFPGDAPTTARLLDGPIADLNVMSRRGRWWHEVRRLPAGARAAAPTGATLLILCSSGEADIRSGSARVRLQAGDAVLMQPSFDAVLAGDGGCLHSVLLGEVRHAGSPAPGSASEARA